MVEEVVNQIELWDTALIQAANQKDMPSFDLVFVGFGHVGRRFVRLLEERRDELHARYDVSWRIVAIATARHGGAVNLDGLDALNVAARVESGGRVDEYEGAVRVTSGADFIQHVAALARTAQARHDEQADSRPAEAGGRGEQGPRRLVLIETTVLDVRAGRPATEHVRAALLEGMDVVTANKGPVAFAYAELEALARAKGRSFLFEGAVMDGIPIFNLARATLPAVRIVGLRGVVNSTTNYIITAMENGREFAESLAEMQAAGIAEADASLDVDGWDAAAKTAALANVFMGARITPQSVDRTGIGSLTGANVRGAVARGRHIKLVSRVERKGNEVRARVAPEELPANDLLATLRDQQNALVFETDLLGDFSIVQLGGGLTQTAYALVSDLVELARDEGRGTRD